MDRKHSGLGIASFVVAVLVMLAMLGVFAVAGVMAASDPAVMDENSADAMMIGLAIIFLFLVDLVALGLGIGGLLQQDRKKLFAVLGLVVSGGIILLTIVLFIVGNLA